MVEGFHHNSALCALVLLCSCALVSSITLPVVIVKEEVQKSTLISLSFCVAEIDSTEEVINEL